MAAVGLVRSVFNGLSRKSSTLKAPVVCRLSAVALQQKYHTVKTAIKVFNSYNIQNGVSQAQCIRQRSHQVPRPTDAEITSRVMKVVKSYDKLATVQLNENCHFINDLGLDSLDHVEIIMAMEDEFGFEIPDADAERLLHPADIIRYVADHEDVYE